MRSRRLAALLLACCLCLGMVVGCSAPEPAADEGAQADEATVASYPDAEVKQKLDSLSLEEKVAQLFIVRPESIAPDDGDITLVDDVVTRGLSENPPGGLCYFAENIETPAQTTALLEDTQEIATDAIGLPLFQAVDEEGGEVARVANNSAMGVRNVGAMGRIGARGDADAVYEATSYIADYLDELGFNLDFAPVADISDGVGNAIGSRAFDSSAEGVTPLVAAAVRAFNDAGILCSAKHFPGIGGAAGDSHKGAIETDATLEEMEESELLPFEAAIEAGVPMVMVGHLSCPAITGDDTPASLSREVVTGVLREKLGFEGLVITDSLEMGAVEGVPAREQGVRAIQAGCDLVLMPEDYDAAYQGVLTAVKTGEISESDLDTHVYRIIKAKLSLQGN